MTAQFHEELIFDGVETSMACDPPLPESHPRLVQHFVAPGPSTGCWRGYIGRWEIKDGHFYLVSVSGKYTLTPGEPLLADWFSGVISIPRGRQLRYVHMDFGSVYEQEVQVTIQRGVVVAIETILNRESEEEDDLFERAWRNMPGNKGFPGDDKSSS